MLIVIVDQNIIILKFYSEDIGLFVISKIEIKRYNSPNPRYLKNLK